MIATLLQKTADVWVHWAIVHLLESTLMLAVVLAVWGLIRKRCPQNVGYVLFLLVMVKLLVPVGVPMPEFLAKYTLSYRISQVLVNHETSREINRERNMVPDMPKPSVLPVFSEPVPVSSQEFTPVTDTFVTDSPIVFDPMTSPAPLIVPETKTEPVVMPEPVLSSENMAQKPVWPVTVWLMLAWAATVLFLMSRFVVTQRRFQKSLRDKKLLDDPVFYPQGMHKKRVNVYACQNISTPAVCGFFRPIILFPDEMLRRLSEEQLRWVLLHELAHIRRRDLQTAFLQRLAVMLHFYNPAVWVASYFMNHLRESACDDMALAADATIPRKKIGDALLSIVEHGAVVDRPIRGALGAFDFASSVRHRLVRLLDKKRILHTKTGVGSMILLILTTVLLVPQWQAMPPMNAATENVVAEDNANTNNTSQENSPQKTDEQKKNEELRKNLEKMLTMSQAEVAATADAYKEGRTDAEQFRQAKIRLLQTELELLQKFPDSQIPDYSKRFPHGPVSISREEAKAAEAAKQATPEATPPQPLSEGMAFPDTSLLLPPVPPIGGTGGPDLAEEKNLSIDQRYARAKLRTAQAVLERALKVNVFSPGVITESEIQKMRADVCQAKISLLKSEPDYLQSAKYQEEVRAKYEQLRDMAKADIEQATEFYQRKIITEAEMDAKLLKLLVVCKN